MKIELLEKGIGKGHGERVNCSEGNTICNASCQYICFQFDHTGNTTA